MAGAIEKNRLVGSAFVMIQTILRKTSFLCGVIVWLTVAACATQNEIHSLSLSFLNEIFFNTVSLEKSEKIQSNYLYSIKNSLLFNHIEKYLNIIKYQKSYDLYNYSVFNIHRQTELQDAGVPSGGGYSTDVLQAKTELVEAMRDRLRARTALQKAKAEFYELFKKYPLDSPPLPKLIPPIDLIPVSVEQAAKIAISNRAELGPDVTLGVAELRARQAWAFAQAARERADLAHDATEISAKFLELAREEREAGRRSLLDTLSGETQLVRAQVLSESAEINFTVAIYNLLAKVGRLNPDAIIRSRSRAVDESGENQPLPIPLAKPEPTSKQVGKSETKAEVLSKIRRANDSGRSELHPNISSRTNDVGEPIGRIVTVTGKVEAAHAGGAKVILKVGDPVYQGDVIETGQLGAVGMEFADESIFSLADSGRMVMQEMDYDPGSQSGQFGTSIDRGAFSFISGQIAKTGPDNMLINTPTATIGIRGTALAGKAAPEGEQSSFTILPEGKFVGEVVISNNAGTVVLNQVGATVSIASINLAPPPPIVITAQQIQQQYGGVLRYLPPPPSGGEDNMVPGQQGAAGPSPDALDTLAAKMGQLNQNTLELNAIQGAENAVIGRLGPAPADDESGLKRQPVDPRNVRTSRVFAGPTQFPPQRFSAYGIVAFPARAASDQDRARHLMICNAYVASLPHVSSLSIPAAWQMATVWPVDSDALALRVNHAPRQEACEPAIDNYGHVQALQALKDARFVGVETSGRGPFLLAWSPPTDKGKHDVLVLWWDLSNVTTPQQAVRTFRFWSGEIERDARLWSNGWNLTRLRLKIGYWADQFGAPAASIFGITE